MLFLFRKIRRSLTSHKGLSTYLFYAIGEILLVVVGILMAVQIDNWNEGRKLKTKEAEYYCKLLEDIEQDNQQIERLLVETEDRLLHANHMLHLLQQPTINPDTLSKEMILSISLITFTFKPSTAAFDDLKSSGNLGLIDETIAKKLRQYYLNVEGIVDVIDVNADQAVKVFNETPSYAKLGWPLMNFLDEALIDSLVDKKQLSEMVRVDQMYKDEMISDAIYYVSASARIRMMYQKLQESIAEMKTILSDKCKNQVIQ